MRVCLNLMVRIACLALLANGVLPAQLRMCQLSDGSIHVGQGCACPECEKPLQPSLCNGDCCGGNCGEDGLEARCCICTEIEAKLAAVLCHPNLRQPTFSVIALIPQAPDCQFASNGLPPRAKRFTRNPLLYHTKDQLII